MASLALAASSAFAQSCPSDRVFASGFQPIAPLLTFSVQPSDTTVNATIAPAVTVVVVDDARCQAIAGQSLEISLGLGSSGAVFGTLMQLTDATGSATFSDVSVDASGTDTLVATAVSPEGGVGAVASVAFNETGTGSCSRQVCNELSGCTQVNLAACGAPFCGLAGLGNSVADPNFETCNADKLWQDSDGDGLSDAAETQGYIDVNCNGVYDPGVDISLPGSDPAVPDIYLHYDYVEAETHTHNPPQPAVDMVVAAFAAHGVHLHIDPVHNAIPETQAKVVTLLTSGPPDYRSDPKCTGPSAMTLHQLKEQYLSAASPAFHYMVFGHYTTCDSAEDCSKYCPPDPECGGGTPPPFGQVGSSQIVGNDAIVSLGPYVDSGVPIPLETWAGMTMHELGHNLGLFHGGGDCDNFKPNYVSVMSYSFYTTGIPIAVSPGDPTPAACLADADCPLAAVPDAHCSTTTHTCYRIDYSAQAFADLNENGLDETAGIRLTGGSADAGNRQISIWFGPDGFLEYPAPTNGSPVDWDLSGAATNMTAAADVNVDSALTVLRSQFDWNLTDGKLDKLNLLYQCNSNYDH